VLSCILKSGVELTKIYRRHLLGDVFVNERDAQRVERGSPGAVKQLPEQEEPYVTHVMLAPFLDVATVALMRKNTLHFARILVFSVNKKSRRNTYAVCFPLSIVGCIYRMFKKSRNP
jgi:hypothetical protein